MKSRLLAFLSLGVILSLAQLPEAAFALPVTYVIGGVLEFTPSDFGTSDAFDLDGARFRAVVVADTGTGSFSVQTDGSSFWVARYVPLSYTIFITSRPGAAPDLTIIMDLFPDNSGSALLETENRLMPGFPSRKYEKLSVLGRNVALEGYLASTPTVGINGQLHYPASGIAPLPSSVPPVDFDKTRIEQVGDLSIASEPCCRYTHHYALTEAFFLPEPRLGLLVMAGLLGLAARRHRRE